MPRKTQLRNIAIVAHVDHGKTTLVDSLFKQGGMYRENQATVDRVMDSNDQERERGITILAKATSVEFGDYSLQLVDTPGHADFGGEVERSLGMVDGILLLVDAAEGPLPQTRFVLRKALAQKLPAVVAINKIDRSDARPEEVLNEVYDLFIELGADDSQIEFPVLYTNGRDGTATADLAAAGSDLRPLVDAIVETVPPPEDHDDEPFCMQVNSIGYDEYVGRLAVGRVLSGTIKTNAMLQVAGPDGDYRARATGLFRFQGVKRLPIDSAASSDIIAVAGLAECVIGDTLSTPENPRTLERIEVEEPTVAMVFQVNDGPLAGRSGGKFLTSRHIRERLDRESYANVSIRIEPGETPEQFRVLGRGELQLAVLIETLRREGYELCVRTPEVVLRDVEGGGKEEPMERLVVDVPQEHMGAVTQLLGPRRGQMLDQKMEGERVQIEFLIPTRGLFGLRNVMLTATRGTAIMSSSFEKWIAWQGPIEKRSQGALVSDRAGETTPYALFNLQPRGELFIPSGTTVYEGMVVGEHARDNDLNVNVVREKKLTNVRAAGKDDATIVAPPRDMTLERCLEWIRDDEMVEVTPEAIRIRKRILAANRRPLKAVGA
ncbi:MAG: translational GTPase TypA [Myxococcota bacterium]